MRGQAILGLSSQALFSFQQREQQQYEGKQNNKRNDGNTPLSHNRVGRHVLVCALLEVPGALLIRHLLFQAM